MKDLSDLRVLKDIEELFGEYHSPLDKDDLLSSISQTGRGSPADAESSSSLLLFGAGVLGGCRGLCTEPGLWACLARRVLLLVR